MQKSCQNAKMAEAHSYRPPRGTNSVARTEEEATSLGTTRIARGLTLRRLMGCRRGVKIIDGWAWARVNYVVMTMTSLNRVRFGSLPVGKAGC